MPRTDLRTVFIFEGSEISFIDRDDGERMVQASDLAGPMGINVRSVLKRVQELHPEDRGALEVHTLGGIQTAAFLTESGALQVLATGRSQQCARLRKVICDVFVAHRRSQLQTFNAVRIGQLEARIDQLEQQLHRLTRLVEGRPPAQVLPFRQPSPPQEDPDWLLIREAAAEMEVSHKSVWRACWLGILKKTRRNKKGHWLVHRSEVERYLDSPFTLCRKRVLDA